jgi:hypothetical protein
MKKLFFLLILISHTSYSQDYGNNTDALKLCSVLKSNNFGTDSMAEGALERILNTIGASKRFVLQPCDNINNAVATSYKGIRYILYDRDFMYSLDNGNNWGNLFILAHEVGHHINGHSLDLVLYASEVVEPKTLEQRRQQELEADEFAGFILAKLGGDISEANKIFLKISDNKDDTYSSHPSRDKRLNAVEIGYNKGLGNKTVIYETPTAAQTAEEYFYLAYEKANKKDYYGAIADYTRVININPNYILAYHNRAFSKGKLNDKYGAIADYTKIIEIDTKNSQAYRTRAVIKKELGDNYGAITDFQEAYYYNPNDASSLYNLAQIKMDLGDSNGAIESWTEAINSDINDDYGLKGTAYGLMAIEKYEKLKDYAGALIDINNAIELTAFDLRGVLYCTKGYIYAYMNNKILACKNARLATGLNFNCYEVKNYACN